ncbi:hypothetical protein [Kitasatospora sp. NPDC002040]|uniref:hypothetical protein n=1 Tax=Kitasatospora sp. NPDC002040 TaxID=3154661 RepID=UPI003322FB86
MSDSDLVPVSSNEAATTSTAVSTSAAPADTGGGVEVSGGGAVSAGGGILAATAEVITEAVKYAIVLTQLTLAGAKLLFLAERVRATYAYVESCAESVERLADQAAGMNVDRDTVNEHREAATVMRAVLEEAEAMAAATEDLSIAFQQTADAHEGDYGPVADAIATKEGDMADREFYSNR